jgi:soluble lytic murein transglycosylase
MPHAKLLALLAVILIFSLNTPAQNFNEIHIKIRSAVENRDYPTAVSELQNLAQTDKNIFALNNYDYLLARTAENRGDFALAAANYEAVVKRNSVLSEYALWHLAQIARSSGNLMLERTYLRQLLTVAPNSLLRDAANARMMRSSFESGDYEAAIAFLSGGQQAAGSGLSRENLVYLAQSYLQLGKIEEARGIFTRLVTNLPNTTQPDDYALAGASGLDELEVGRENFGRQVAKLSEGEHYRRAVIYQFNREFALARLHYAAIFENFPQSTFASEALYQTGRGYAQVNVYDEAVKWFERVQAEFPEHPISRDALSQAASAYSRLNRPKEAISRYQRFIEKYPNAENLDRAYLNIIDIKRDSGEDFEALRQAARTREVFKGKLSEAIALFVQARIRIAQNDWTNALADLNALQNFADLGGTRVPGGTNKSEITFLKGFVLENLGRYGEAIDVYLSLPDGRNEYYGWRATERLRALASNEKSSQFIQQKLNELRFNANREISPQNADSVRQAAQTALRLTNDEAVKNQLLDTIRKTYAALPAYQKIPGFRLLELGRREVLKEKRNVQTNYHQTLADELLFLGLYDEGTPELEEGRRADGQKPIEDQDYRYTLAVYYNRGDMAHRAVSFAEPLWRNVPADYQVELIPREQIELLYPAPYADSFLQYSSPRNVDPRFALSIMRQESRFRPDVKSNAAARGLMQFISTTSNTIAAELGKNNFRQDELYNPPTAILFGSQYLANLFKMFPNQPQAVVASYNGGEINMARWMTRSKSDNPDRYVPEILFTQSKDYVYKVMANYRVYQTFYDEKLRAIR